MYSLSNDLVDREEELNAVLRREKIYLQKISAMEKNQAVDDIVRSELSRRLEEVLAEKEEILNPETSQPNTPMKVTERPKRIESLEQGDEFLQV